MALVVGLSGVLIGSGLGSAWISRLNPNRAAWRARIALAALVVGLALLSLFLGPLVLRLIDAPPYARLMSALGLVGSMGLLMGMPLPLGLQILHRHPADRELIPWAWGLNGALSVLGSCLAIIIALFGGFTLALQAAVAVYALACCVMLTTPDRSNA